jgi:hypothetical protein
MPAAIVTAEAIPARGRFSLSAGGRCYAAATTAGAHACCDRLPADGACGPRATGARLDLRADVVFLRYLDVCLVLATAPFVLVGGMPLFGYLVGACAWVLTRVGTAFVHERARRVSDPKLRAGLQVGGMMGRVWIVAFAVVLARLAGGKSDGIMAAALVLAAFTVYFVMSFVTREGPLQRASSARGRPSTS